LEQYAFEVSDVLKGRGAYICITENGKKIIKAYDASEIRAEALCLFLQEVKAKGVPADSIIRTKDDKVLAADIDGTTYYARDYIEGRECETKNREDVLASMGALARFHNCMNGYEREIPEGMRVSPDMLVLEYEKHNREIRRVRKYLHQKGQKQSFEISLQGACDYFLEQAEEVTRQWKEYCGNMKGQEPSDKEGTVAFCHGDYQYHNILLGSKGWFLVNFEKCLPDDPVRDLYLLLRKLLEKGNWSVSLGTELLEAYGRQRPVAAGSWIDLYYRLAYPEKFWKIVNFYYNSGKAWIPGRNMDKLEKLLAQEPEKVAFLEKYRSIYGG